MTVQHRFDTHDIVNQSPPYEDVDLFARVTPDQKTRSSARCGRAGTSSASSGMG